MAPSMKAMKAMKAAKKTGVLTQTQVMASGAETSGLKKKHVKAVIEGLFGVAPKAKRTECWRRLKSWHPLRRPVV